MNIHVGSSSKKSHKYKNINYNEALELKENLKFPEPNFTGPVVVIPKYTFTSVALTTSTVKSKQ